MNKKPTIGFFLPSTDLSGGTMVICHHAIRLLNKGYDVLLINSQIDGLHDIPWFPNLAVPIEPFNQVNRPIDIACATHWSTAFIVKDFPAQRKFYFIQSDETRFNLPDSNETKLASETYTFDFEMIVIAKWLQEWIKDRFGKNAFYVPNGLDNTLFYPDNPFEPKGDQLRVLLEGSLIQTFKGMDEAFKVVKGMDCEVWCVSNEGQLKRNWKCDKFFKNVPLKEMRRIYSSCDVLIKMSKVEGFFMPPLEMMACGGTVITNKVTGYDEYIVDGYNGLVVDSGDVEDARKKLQLLIDDRTFLRTLQKGGRETSENWTWEFSNAQFEKIINQEF